MDADGIGGEDGTAFLLRVRGSALHGSGFGGGGVEEDEAGEVAKFPREHGGGRQVAKAGPLFLRFVVKGFRHGQGAREKSPTRVATPAENRKTPDRRGGNRRLAPLTRFVMTQFRQRKKMVKTGSVTDIIRPMTSGTPTPRTLAAFSLALVAISCPGGEKIDFNRDIRPLLSNRCVACHGPDEEERKADLRLDTAEGAGADLGGYASLVPGDPEASELFYRITTDEEDDLMRLDSAARTTEAAPSLPSSAPSTRCLSRRLARRWPG